jgi:plasmid maintenance system killer protein
MSILSSTNSGKQTALTEEFLLSSGWELSVDLFSAKIYRYTPKILQTDRPLSITFNTGSEYYLYKGKYKNINIDFRITSIGELQELISYYFNELKDPEKAFLSIKNNKNVEISFDYDAKDWVSFSTTGTLYKSYL